MAPLSRAQGARPAKAATCCRFNWPNSGRCAGTDPPAARSLIQTGLVALRQKRMHEPTQVRIEGVEPVWIRGVVTRKNDGVADFRDLQSEHVKPGAIGDAVATGQQLPRRRGGESIRVNERRSSRDVRDENSVPRRRDLHPRHDRRVRGPQNPRSVGCHVGLGQPERQSGAGGKQRHHVVCETGAEL